MKQAVIAITGPTGAGKSTISQGLAKKLDRCVYLEIDNVKHMLISGFSHKTNENGEERWSFSEWKQVGESVGLLCANFLANGFSVVAGGYMHEEGWLELEKQCVLTNKFILLPSKEVIKFRDAERDSIYTMGNAAIKQHFNYLTEKQFFKDFMVLDSTDQTVDQTVEELLRRIAGV